MGQTVLGADSITPNEYLEKTVLGRDETPDTSSSIARAEDQPPRQPSFHVKAAPPWILYTAAFTMLATGTFDSLLTKWMNRTKAPTCYGCKEVGFEAPFWQSFTMYLGELICLGVYYLDKFISKKKNKPMALDFPTSALSINKPKSPIYWWIIPTVLDFIASTMINYAFLYTFASTVQMLRNFNIILTALLSVCYIRVPLRVHEVTGVLIVTGGLVISGTWGILNTDSSTSDESKAWLGIVMAIAGTSMTAFQFVFEESLFRKYYASPFFAVGYMGFFGTIIGALSLVVTQYAGWEDVKGSMYQLSQNKTMLASNILFVFSVSLFNGSGLVVTKLGSCLLRAVMFSARSVTMFFMELFLGWNPFAVLNFVGLCVLTIGVLMYNNIFQYCIGEKWTAKLKKQVNMKCCKTDGQKAEELEKEARTKYEAESVA